jgi:hypothetical protein
MQTDDPHDQDDGRRQDAAMDGRQMACCPPSCRSLCIAACGRIQPDAGRGEPWPPNGARSVSHGRASAPSAAAAPRPRAGSCTTKTKLELEARRTVVLVSGFCLGAKAGGNHSPDATSAPTPDDAPAAI